MHRNILSAWLIGMLISSPTWAADSDLFLREISRTGPTRFVKWVEQYYGEREEGKSGFDAEGNQVGSITGALVGGSIGLFLGDGKNMLGDLKHGATTGSKDGAWLGGTMAKGVGNSDELEEVITDYINDRQLLLDAVTQAVQSCVQKGGVFSQCRKSQAVAKLTSQISQLNYAYCRQATAVKQPNNPSQPILVPQLCQS